jgi:hypothetical protein
VGNVAIASSVLVSSEADSWFDETQRRRAGRSTHRIKPRKHRQKQQKKSCRYDPQISFREI